MAYMDGLLIVHGAIGADGNPVFKPLAAGATVCENVIDLQASRDVGEGEDLYVRAFIGSALTGATTLKVEAITSDAPNLSSPLVIASSGDVPASEVNKLGYVAAKLGPQLGSLGKRYLGARITSGGSPTSDTVMADFGIEIGDGAKAYPSGFEV